MALKLILFVSCLLGVILAAPTTKECVEKTGYEAITCYFRTQDLVSKIGHVDLSDEKSMAEFKKTCDALKPCNDYIRCNSKDQEVLDAANQMTSYCDIFVYLGHDFKDCDNKLNAKNSTCYDKWDPFPVLDEDGAENPKNAAAQKEACKNFYGKDECLKTEIVKVCGQKQFDGFEKQFKNLNKMLGLCDSYGKKKFF